MCLVNHFITQKYSIFIGHLNHRMKKHLFLNNPRGESKKFEAGRIIEDKEDLPPEKIATGYRKQKDILSGNRATFLQQREARTANRTLDIPDHIDYVLVNFFPVFNNSEEFKTRSRFEKDFGLEAVLYSNLNQTVLFAIGNEEKFDYFLDLLERFINSQDNVHPSGQAYNVITLIHSFAFLNLKTDFAVDDLQAVVLGLVTETPAIGDRYSSIFTALLELLDERSREVDGITYNTDYQSSIEIKSISPDLLREIVSNFDIIHSVHSLRVPTIHQNIFNQPELTWDLRIRPPANRNIIIGVVDNGVRRIAPLENIIVDRRIDITNTQQPNPTRADHPHGTTVATLAAIGDRYFDSEARDIEADAMIMPIKILNFGTGYLNIYDIRAAIERGIKAGVRIFNLSVCGPGKMYNESYSDYAFLLDKLTFEHDILIIIASGNLEEQDIQAMQNAIEGDRASHFHTYPNHFYNPYEQTAEHSCEATNICIPAESLNNLTVGAIADNLIPGSPTALTPFKELPAFYSRKWHLDYNRKINGRPVARKQTNHNIRKPDIVLPGGDLLLEQSRMHVVGFGENAMDFYVRESGTSLAVPLASNLAARIIREYPDFNMQTVKALIINSAESFAFGDLLEPLVEKVKDQIALDYFGDGFANLGRGEKMAISSHLSEEKLFGRLAGYGTPDTQKTLFSDKKRATVVIQDSIALGSHKAIKLNIPDYLLRYSKTGYILTFKATLCYKFRPLPNNQLGYNPLHISFNIFGHITRDVGPTATIIADKQHSWYNKFVRDIEDEKGRSKAKNDALAIKTNAKSWSEDFFPSSSKPFSNTQQFEIKINTAELQKVKNQITIAIRCTHKRDLPSYVENDLSKRTHDFSIALEIVEKPNKELRNFDLYDELVAINELNIYPSQELDIETGDLEAEA